MLVFNTELVKIAQNTAPAIPKPRAPRRCKLCPGNPLKSQCEHTAAGRTYLSEQRAEESVGRPESSSPGIHNTMTLPQESSPFVRISKSPEANRLITPYS